MERRTGSRSASAATLLLACICGASAHGSAQQAPSEKVQSAIERLQREIDELKAQSPSVVGNTVGVTESALSFGIARTDINNLIDIPDLDAEGPSIASSVDLRFWGRAKFDAIHDNFQESNTTFTDFGTFAVTEGRDEVNFVPRDSRFGVAATSSANGWTSRAVIETDFYGGNAGTNLQARVRLGYAELKHESGWSLRTGQDWTPIMTQNPGMIDFGLFNRGGNVFFLVPQVTLRREKDGVNFVLTALKHRISTSQQQQEHMPWIASRVGFCGDEGKREIAINGGWRQASINGVDYESFLLGIDGKIQLTDCIKVNGEVWTGQGIGREFLRGGLDENFATGNEISSWGGFVSLEYAASQEVRFNLGYGIDDPSNGDVQGSAAPFQKNQIAFFNARYLMSKNYGVGAEVVHYDTQLIGGSDIDGQRVLLSWWYIF